MANGFLVEDGSQVANATSYVSVAGANTLLDAHFNEAEWTALSVDDRELALMRAAEYLDTRFRWYGDALSDAQGLMWPRTKHYSKKGFPIAAGTIPTELKKANALVAMAAVKEANLYTEMGQTGAVKQYFTEGLNVIFDPKTTEENQFMGKRFIDVELLLKNIGEFKSVDYIKSSRITEVSSS